MTEASGIFVLGSTGPAGEIFVRKLRERDRRVVVMHRSDQRRREFEALGAEVIHGDAMDRDSVFAATRRAAETCNTVVNYMGGFPLNDPSTWPDYEGNKNAIDAAEAAGIRRFIFVTSIGTGDSFQYVPETSITRPILQLKTRAEEHLRDSGLDWTIVKPGGLGKPGSVPRTGKPIATENEAVRGSIDREDLADAVLSVLDDQNGITRGKALHVVATNIKVFEGELTPFRFSD